MTQLSNERTTERSFADELGGHAIFSRLAVTSDTDWAATVATALLELDELPLDFSSASRKMALLFAESRRLHGSLGGERAFSQPRNRSCSRTLVSTRFCVGSAIEHETSCVTRCRDAASRKNLRFDIFQWHQRC
jgi:hypothetical protein